MKKSRVRTHTNPFTFHEKLAPLDFSTVFEKNTGQFDLEVGFGKGVFLCHWAKLNPQNNIVGVEVRKGIVDIVEKKTTEFKNTHLIHNSAERVLEDLIPDDSLNNIFIFHPDPWFKKSHHKRRFIRPDIVDLLIKKMAKGAKLYVSTDVEILWEAMDETLNESTLKKVDDQHFWDNIYTSHWDKFSIVDERTRSFGTWEKN
jgi:tRNA (guanine-N7-)-methyltransferase